MKQSLCNNFQQLDYSNEIQKSMVNCLNLFQIVVGKNLASDTKEKIIKICQKLGECYQKSIKQNEQFDMIFNENNLNLLKDLNKLFAEIDLYQQLDELKAENIQIGLKKANEIIMTQVNFEIQTNEKPIDKFKLENGPWNIQAQEIKQEIISALNSVETNKAINDQLKEKIALSLKQLQQIQDLERVKESLESRVAEVQQKAERCFMLEQEKLKYLERIDHLKSSVEKLSQEIGDLKQNKNQLEDQLEKMISQKSSSQEYVTGRNKFKNNDDSNNLQGYDAYLVNQLNREIFELKSIDIRNRIEKMENSMPNFQEMIKRLDNTKSVQKNPLHQLKNIQNRAKDIMANQQVVDLSKIQNQNSRERDNYLSQFIQNDNIDLKRLKSQAISVSKDFFSNLRSVKNHNQFNQFIDINLNNQKSVDYPLFGQIQIGEDGSSKQQKVEKAFVTLNQYNYLVKKYVNLV